MKKVLFTLLLVLLFSTMFFAQGPKYIFMFIGDGMGTTQTNAAQIYKSTLGNAEVPKLNMLTFPVQGMTTTYAANAFITDSAAAGTALATGYKTNSGIISMDPSLNTVLETLAERAKALGRKVGIISSVSIDHATPAVFYAHQASRSSYYEISRQLVESGFDFFGGGSVRYPTGKQGDQENIFDYAAANGYNVIQTQSEYEEFDAMAKTAEYEKVWIMNEEVDSGSAMYYALDKKETFDLADITKTAINYLDNDNGFFIMVEGGKIDWACHANDAAASIEDTLAFDKAIKEAMAFYSKHPNDTLIVVTGDHETGGLTIGFAGTQYDSNPELIRYQRESFDIFTARLNELKKAGNLNSFEQDLMPLVENAFGLYLNSSNASNPDLILSALEEKRLRAAFDAFINGIENDEETYLLYGGYNPVTMSCTRILNQKAGLGWTTYAHTGVPVVTYAMGNGQELFAGYYDNTEIAKNLFALLK
ncbi:MAG: alkaline phosphatase [Thermotogaceae bacterium]|nr:alkaline phosphatase [Thermotogaceae bacterium]